MDILKKLLSSFFFIAFSSHFSFAQVTFFAYTDKKTINKNELLKVKFTVAKARNIESLIPPFFKNFIVKSGPTHNSSMENVNGNILSSVSIDFLLQPLTTGFLTIGSAIAKVDGKLYYTKPFDIKVTPSSSKSESIDENPKSIKNQSISDFLKETKRVITDNRSTMNGVKLSFNIPKEWKELPNLIKRNAYYFFSNILNVELQVGVSPPSSDNDITEEVIQEFNKLYPNIKYQRRLKVAGKNAYEITYSTIKRSGNTIVYLNTLVVLFFHNSKLVIVSYDNGSFNQEEGLQNIKDLKIVYRNLIKTIKILK